jgi:acyl-CoA synthetase (AMP-forming)/AMP-acid ligase II
MLRRSARIYADLVAVESQARRLTYAQVIDRATRLGNALRQRGCEPGDHIAVVLPNCVETMEIEFGCALAGLVRVALNFRLADEELLRTLDKMSVRGVVYTDRRTALIDAARERIPNLVTLRLGLEEEELGPEPDDDYRRALDDVLPTPHDADIGAESLYSIFCSSGTTGTPKGIMLSRRAQLAVAFNMLLELGPVLPGDGVLLPQPLSHGAGFFMLPYFLSGGRCAVVERYDAAGLYDAAERHRVSTIKLVPVMLREMLDAGAKPEGAYRPQRIIYGAAPMPRDVVDRAREVFGEIMVQIYGQGETPLCITVLTEVDHMDPTKLESAGRPWRSVDVRVVDDNGQEVQPGEHGEVVVRGLHAMSGYWGDPDQTAKVMRDGAIHTNDRATIDDGGYIHLLGRMDDVINSGGFNIPSVVVEHVLVEHPGIVEAAVTGVPDDRWGERVAAFVVVRDGSSPSLDELIEYCRGRLGMQRPRSIDFVEKLPRNAYGKVDKARLVSRSSTEERREGVQ